MQLMQSYRGAGAIYNKSLHCLQSNRCHLVKIFVLKNTAKDDIASNMRSTRIYFQILKVSQSARFLCF